MKPHQQIKSIYWILIGALIVLISGILIGEIIIFYKYHVYKILFLFFIPLILVTILLMFYLYRFTLKKYQLENKTDILTKIAQTSPVGITLMDENGKIVFANERAENILGLSCNKLEYTSYNATSFKISDIDGNDFPDEELPFSLVKNSLKPVNDIQHFIEWPNGKRVLLSINATPLFDDNYKFTGVVASFEDITERKSAEIKFNELYFRNEAILSTVLDIIMEVDENKVYTWANKAGYEFFGDDVIGKEAAYYFEGEQDTYQNADPLFKGNSNFVYIESWQRRRDGGKRLLAWYCTVLKDANGNIIGVLSTARDITEYKKIEESLRQSEEKYRTIFNESPLGIITSGKDFKIITANVSFCNMIGYTEEELKSLTFKDITHPDHLGGDETSVIKLLHGEIPLYQTEKRYIRKDKNIIWALLTVSIIKDIKGNFQFFLAMIEDITKSKIAIDALRESEVLYRMVTENSPVALFLHSNGKFVYLNPAALKMLHANCQEDLIGQPILERVHPDWKHVVTERIKQAEEKNIPPGLLDEKFICLDGDIIDVQVQAVPVEWHGQSVMLVFAQDITDRKKAELAIKNNEELLKTQNEEYLTLNEELSESNERIQRINEELIIAKEKAEESDRLKTAFLCNMSHEIRTPMNAIMGFSDLLMHENLSLNKKELYTQLIRERSDDLLRIIEDILDISKIDVGQMTIFNSDFSVMSLMKEIFEYYNVRKYKLTNKSNVLLKLHVHENITNLSINSDKQRIKQVLNNLIDNSIKFTETGSIEFGYTLNSENEIQFYVKDTGIGIPEDKFDIIFNRFRQADESLASRKYGGTGLGLSIVKGIVDLLKGKIWLESELNVGTIFYFTLPISPVNGHIENKMYHQGPQSEKFNSKSSILIVEDDEASLEFFKELLNDTNLNIYSASNGKDALEIIDKHPLINLVLMDIRLPDTNGLDLTRIMKKNNPDLIVVAQTAYAGSIDYKECINAGCDNYVSKPINRDKLFSVLHKYLK